MWGWVKIPKGIALAAFLFPWLTVSCSSQKLFTASGWNLLTGRINFTNPLTGVIESRSGEFNFFLLLAVAAIIGGLVVSVVQPRTAAWRTLGTSIFALFCVWAATSGMSKEAIVQAAQESGRGGFDMSMAQLIQVELEIGYWMANLALTAAALLSWMTMSGRSFTISAEANPPPTT